MAKEIERKFLLKNDGWKGLGKSMHIMQAYLHRSENSTIRVRIVGNREAFLTIKSKTVGISRDEFEYPIELSCAQLLFKDIEQNQIIEKTRNIAIYQGHTWEIDEFLGDNLGLIVAEIELDNPDEAFEKPDWIGDEVSGIARYYNSKLLIYPYKNWSQSEKENIESH